MSVLYASIVNLDAVQNEAMEYLSAKAPRYDGFVYVEWISLSQKVKAIKALSLVIKSEQEQTSFAVLITFN